MQHGASIHLKIPFFRQHFEFTCGPASLMMAMKYLDDSMGLSKDLEIDIWREAPWSRSAVRADGLAFSTAVRGFSVRVTSNSGRLDFVDRFEPPLDDDAMVLLMNEFPNGGSVPEGSGKNEETITAEIFRTILFSIHVPLIMTSSRFHGSDDLPHWVAITGIDDTFLYFSDPSDARIRKRKIGP